MTGESDIDGFLTDCLAGKAALWPAMFDSANVSQRVSYHGIAGLLLAREELMHGWPDSLRHAIRAEAHLQSLWEASHHAVLAALIERLAAAGMASLVLKGTALAYSVYADPAIRRRGDSDVLVRASDLAKAQQVLAREGFIRNEGRQLAQETWLRTAGDGFTHAVDLHWEVTGSPALNTVLRAEQFFAQPMALPRLSPSALAPDTVSLFLHNCVNHAQHRELGYLAGNARVLSRYRLIWCHDTFLQAADFESSEWRSLAEKALSAGLAKLCLSDLRQAAAIFAFAIPPEVEDTFAQASEQTPASHYLSRASAHQRIIADFRATAQFGDRLRLIGNHLFPSGAHLRERYPEAEKWPLPMLQLRRLAALPWRLVTRR
ncbi:MAG: nucleotidyltransferase family protein [Erythrobacter sp.]|nr:MAG: nucleotidyltransferase family protein [Erythrobacter sp.]